MTSSAKRRVIAMQKRKPPVTRAHTRHAAPANAAPGMGPAFARLSRQAKNARRRVSPTDGQAQANALFDMNGDRNGTN
jgi:hypothetical protein